MGQKVTQSEHRKHDPIYQTQRTTTLFQNRLNHQTNKVKTQQQKIEEKKQRERERKKETKKRE